MLDCLNSELSGNARKILVMLLRGEKSESKEVSVLQSKARGSGVAAASCIRRNMAGSSFQVAGHF